MRRVRDGFTIVELIITLVVMVILTGLSVVIVGNIQAQARDSEREQDIQALARGLETRYKQSNTYTLEGSDPPQTVTAGPGKYPGDNEMWQWGWYRSIPDNKIFVGASEQSILSPSGERLNYVCALAGFSPEKCDKAEKPSNIEELFRENGTGDLRDIYLYESTTSDKRYCNNDPIWNGRDDCTRFNLYWISETDKTINPQYPNIPGIKILRSKHQQ